MPVVGDLLINLRASTASFTRELRQARDFTARTSQDIIGSLGRIKIAFPALALTAATGLASLVRSAIEAGDELAKLSQKTGISARDLSSLKLAAELSNVSMEQLATGMARLSARMVSASAGMGEAANAFQRLQIHVRDSRGNFRPLQEVLGDLAERFARLPDGAEKTALAMQIFGKAGAELIPLLNLGREGLQEMAREAERAGLVMDDQTARAAERLNDQLVLLETNVKGVGQRIGLALIPPLNDLLSAFRASIQESGGLLQAMGKLITASGSAELSVKIFTERLRRENKEIQESIEEDVRSLARQLKETTKGNLGGEQLIQEQIAAAPSTKAIKQFEILRKQLELQIQTFGMSREQVEIYKLSLEGLRPAQVAVLENLLAQIRALERQREILQQLRQQKLAGLDLQAPRKIRALGIAIDEQEAPEITGLNIDLLRNVADAMQTIGREVDRANESFLRLHPPIERAAELAEQLGNNVRNAFQQALIHGRGFSSLLQTILEQLALLALQFVGKSLFGGLKGRGGFLNFLGSLLGGLFGFQHGGSFRVGGSGGPDSTLVAFRATPGEEVQIFPPGFRSSPSTQIFIDARGADAGVEHRIRRALDVLHRSAVLEAVEVQKQARLRRP